MEHAKGSALKPEEIVLFRQFEELWSGHYISFEEKALLPRPLFVIFAEIQIFSIVRHPNFREILARGHQRRKELLLSKQRIAA